MENKEKSLLCTNNYRSEIRKLVRDSKEYPSMQDVIDHCKGMDGAAFVELFIEMLKMQDEGKILYDSKHDSWLWTEPSETMKQMMKNAVRL